MLISNTIDLFEKLKKEQRLCIFVHMDVDALCACKILQSVLNVENIRYTLIGIQLLQTLVNSFNDQKDRYKTFVFLNCGANIDLLDQLNPEEELNIYVVDSHRPVDVVNFFCDSQIFIVMKPEDIEAIPDYSDLHYDEEDEDEEEDENIGHEEAMSKQIRKRRWERRRQEVMQAYEETSHFSYSISLLMFELAWKKSKDNNLLLWWAVTGATSQFLNQEVGRERYISYVLQLQGHMSRLNHTAQDERHSRSIQSLKISFENDLDLALFRHWSLLESLRHSFVTMTSFRVWTNNGSKKLHQFMAEMGISILQCRQEYVCMESKIRESLEQCIEETAEKFGVKNIKLQSFIAQHAFENKISASDMVYVLSALLEKKNEKNDEEAKQENFFDALTCLSRISEQSISNGITLAKEELQIIKLNIENALLNFGSVVCLGPYLYFDVKEGNPDWKSFSEPIFLTNFSCYLHHCYLKTLSRKKLDKAIHLPMVVAAPSDEANDYTLVIGLPPATDDTRKNLFGAWFSKASEKTPSKVDKDYFNTSIIKVRTEHKSRFFDALIQIPIVMSTK